MTAALVDPGAIRSPRLAPGSDFYEPELKSRFFVPVTIEQSLIRTNIQCTVHNPGREDTAQFTKFISKIVKENY